MSWGHYKWPCVPGSGTVIEDLIETLTTLTRHSIHDTECGCESLFGTLSCNVGARPSGYEVDEYGSIRALTSEIARPLDWNLGPGRTTCARLNNNIITDVTKGTALRRTALSLPFSFHDLGVSQGHIAIMTMPVSWRWASRPQLANTIPRPGPLIHVNVINYTSRTLARWTYDIVRLCRLLLLIIILWWSTVWKQALVVPPNLRLPRPCHCHHDDNHGIMQRRLSGVTTIGDAPVLKMRTPLSVCS